MSADDQGGGRPSGGGAAASPAAGPARRDPVGYVIVLVSYLLMAGTAPLVAWANAPEAIILALRMAFAAVALGVVFLRRPMIADWRRPGAAWRLILMAAMSSVTLLLYFYAVLHTSVAIAVFFLFLMLCEIFRCPVGNPLEIRLIPTVGYKLGRNLQFRSQTPEWLITWETGITLGLQAQISPCWQAA